MKTKSAADKEKEREQKLKELRRDLEEKLEDQLSPEMMDEKTRVEIEKIDVNEELPAERSKRVIEALLFASSKPVSAREIRRVLKFLTIKQIEDMVSELHDEYLAENRSFEILEIAGGYEIATRKEFAPWICRVEMQKKTRQATQSALETLAILAYKQPLTRAEIEELRGVDASGVLSNLMERGFVKIVGKKEIPGRPFLYATTEKFLEHFGLKSLKDLPNIDEIRTMVEQSVRKDELLGKQKMVDVAADQASENVQSSSDEPASSETAEAAEAGSANTEEDSAEEEEFKSESVDAQEFAAAADEGQSPENGEIEENFAEVSQSEEVNSQEAGDSDGEEKEV